MHGKIVIFYKTKICIFLRKTKNTAKITDNIIFLIFYYFEACNDNFIQINKYFYFKVPTPHLMIFFNLY